MAMIHSSSSSFRRATFSTWTTPETRTTRSKVQNILGLNSTKPGEPGGGIGGWTRTTLVISEFLAATCPYYWRVPWSCEVGGFTRTPLGTRTTRFSCRHLS